MQGASKKAALKLDILQVRVNAMKGKMKALVIRKPNDLKVQDVEIPAIGRDEILIKSRASGICHSDYELIRGKYIVPFGYPITPGHEWSGEIVEAGEDVKTFAAGDRVTGECVIGCGNCALCQSGNFTNCPNADHFGFTIDGADSEYFRARPEWLHKLPDTVSFEAGALVEPFTVGFYAIDVNGGTNASETVVISGGGNIGLCALAVSKGMGARTILVEPAPQRIEVAIRLGADFVVDPSNQDPVARVLDLTRGEGADLVIEAAGVEASLKSVFDYARNNGRISMVGINIGNMIPVELGKIQMKGLIVRGCVGSPYVWEKALRFLEFAKIDLTPIQTHRFPLEKAEEAFELASQRDKCIKVVLLND
jgi:L-iditol 2-dehydrogenase